MITFAYTPTGSSASVVTTLLDSDRFWPARLEFTGAGDTDPIEPIRGIEQLQVARGLLRVQIQFMAQRQHGTLFAAIQHVSDSIQKMNGTRGTLLLQIPGGGTLRSRNCVCVSASGYNIGVATYSTFAFIGGRPSP